MTESHKIKIIFIMGVSGVGKSTIGKLLSLEMNIPFFDGDDFHPEENIQKMSKGMALNDKDRSGWLQSLNNLAMREFKKKGCIIACSALKEEYRNILSAYIKENTNWVFLHGSFELIEERINNREGHFMSSQLLKSQFDILEEPKHAIKIPMDLSPNEVVTAISKVI